MNSQHLEPHIFLEVPDCSPTLVHCYPTKSYQLLLQLLCYESYPFHLSAVWRSLSVTTSFLQSCKGGYTYFTVLPVFNMAAMFLWQQKVTMFREMQLNLLKENPRLCFIHGLFSGWFKSRPLKRQPSTACFYEWHVFTVNLFRIFC